MVFDRPLLSSTGITATAGIGTNLYLAKVAMDILAKHEQPDENGVRMAALDEQTYKERLWGHTPITDFWRIGRGYARKLALYGMHTMGDIARVSLGGRDDELNEATLFKLFGKNAELLIDHAWGVEPVSMEVIKAYRPTAKCKSSGQVLSRPYTADEARTVVWEMADQLALDLMAKGIVTSKLTLTISYDSTSLDDPKVKAAYKGEITADHFGRAHPKHAHGTINIANYTSLSNELTRAALTLYDDIIDANLLIRKVTITAERVISESAAKKQVITNQLSLFDVNRECKDEKETALDKAREQAREQKRVLQSVLLDVRDKFGKNAVIRAGSLKEEGTARQRNNQIGGHSA